MSNERIVNISDVDANEEQKNKEVNNTSSLTEEAYSVVKHSNGSWNVVRIEFNLETQEVGVPIIVRSDINRQTVIEQFKIEVGKSKLLR